MGKEEVRIAILSAEEVARVEALERELGEDYVVIAYDKPLQPAELDDEQLRELRRAEAEIGKAYLVAYKKPQAPAQSD